MDLSRASVIVTGGASGLGLASATELSRLAAHVVIADLPTSPGAEVAREFGATFVPADVTDTEQMIAAVQAAAAAAPLRAVVHCAGRGGPQRVLTREGAPADLSHFEAVVRVNLVGTFNVLRLAAAEMAKNEPVDGERGVVVFTSSVAAFEGQIGQIPYASSKAGVQGMTLVAARDLARSLIRVCTIAPGLFDTPLLAGLPEQARAALGASVPHPARLGTAAEFAHLARSIIENPMLNGETIRLDGAIRMAPR